MSLSLLTTIPAGTQSHKAWNFTPPQVKSMFEIHPLNGTHIHKSSHFACDIPYVHIKSHSNSSSFSHL
ncbi:Uncharacterized protein TCM_013543 [Theobroma cacao]|uniref:Uncharacterized protein n=1 Tax=Theobroma cacao TaxID=3641 RepID=A0A061G3M2_THECC|nr:Uncharacterized protein TCM_013543 [Theobroma cacao]